MSSAGGGDGEGSEQGFAGTLVERSRVLAVLTIVILCAVPLAVVSSAWKEFEAFSLGVMVATVALIPLAAWLNYSSARRTEIRLRETPEGLVVSSDKGTQLIARGSFRKGTSFEALGGLHMVALRRLGSSMRIEVARPELARLVLSAVGADRREGTTRFSVERMSSGSGIASGIGAALLFSASLFLGLPGAAILLLWFAAAVLIVLGVLSKRITLTIGADGIELKPLLGKRRFVPHDRIELVRALSPPSGELVSWGFEITGKDSGEVIRLDTRAERFRGGIWSTDPVRDAVARAWSSAHQRASATSMVHQLASADASTKEWIAKLRALGTGHQHADYRAPAVDERALFDVVTDANAEAELRAAAAVALGANPEHAPRLRVMADDIADDRIRRVALAAVEPEADDRLEEELEPLKRMRAR